MPTLVYLGPSLPVADAKKILPDAKYLPPIRRGDLDNIKKPAGVTAVIIDGVFHHNLAVSVVEVRSFLGKGGIVYGASSMGALRAVELKPLGMIGIGRIYEDYLSGKLNSDEDVALSLCPESGRALTVPTVQVKYAVREARASGKISDATARAALAASKKIYYPERTLQMLLKTWAGKIPAKELGILRAILKNPEKDPKRRDAVKALSIVAGKALAPRANGSKIKPIYTNRVGPVK